MKMLAPPLAFVVAVSVFSGAFCAAGNVDCSARDVDCIAASGLNLLQTGLRKVEVPQEVPQDVLAGAFHDTFDEEDRQRFYELLQVFADVAQHINVTYSLFFNSLHGAYCVGDQLAWDDDGDLAVFDGWHRLENLADGADQYLRDRYAGKYRIARDSRFPEGANLKFFSMEGKRHLGRPDMPWLGPFLDMWYISCTDRVPDQKASLPVTASHRCSQGSAGRGGSW